MKFPRQRDTKTKSKMYYDDRTSCIRVWKINLRQQDLGRRRREHDRRHGKNKTRKIEGRPKNTEEDEAGDINGRQDEEERRTQASRSKDERDA